MQIKTTALENGNVLVSKTYFDGTEMVTDTGELTAIGAYVYAINPNGTTSQVCEGLLPTGPTLMAGENLLKAVNRTLGITTQKFTPEIDADALRSAVEGVEGNNKQNGGSWNEWDDAAHVSEVYEIELCEEGKTVIERAIKSNGATLAADLSAVHLAVWGVEFDGGWWCRENREA